MSSSTTGSLLAAIDRSLAAGDTTILINLQDILFIDSIGLATLVVALKRVRTANGRLALCGLNGQAQMLLNQSGMEKVFEIYASPEDFTRLAE
nr:STAS domain-containing protein [Leptolyngbya sp. FACHB-36]